LLSKDEKKGEMPVSNGIGFGNTIKSYFTACYRAHMLKFGDQFDLWDPAAVQAEWNKISNQVTGGNMPAAGCPEGVWDLVTQAQFLSDFQAWKAAGFPS
jgi:hypothetical protein